MSSPDRTEEVPWQEIGVKPLFSGRYLALEQVDFLRNGGELKEYEVLKSGDFAMVVPITESGDTFLIREFRAPVRRYIWTLPAGMIDPDEHSDPFLAAVRELKEETALQATDLYYLGKFTALAGATDAHLHLFAARVDEDSVTAPAVREGIIEVRRIPLQEALRWIAEGRIDSPHGIAALHMTANALGYSFQNSSI